MQLPVVPSSNVSSSAQSPALPGWLELPRVEQQAQLERLEQPQYRHQQIERWVFHRRATTFSQMTDLPIVLREELERRFVLMTSRIMRHHRAADGTEKLVLGFSDGGQAECVLLRDGGRRTVCLSSQVGCAMGCVFCASGLDGVKRNLQASEILEQLLLLQRLLPDQERLSHIVMMGMGEPLANLESVLAALRLASSRRGLGISARRITISTVGLPVAIDQLTQQNSRYHLAVSLHAADDQLRNELVPVNRNIGLQSILEAAERYFHVSGRRLTYEYVLLGGVNDSPTHAQRLASRLAHQSALMNVIPYNPVAGLPYRTPAERDVERFCEVLRRRGVNVQVRQRKGDEISAACGQLRRTSQDKELSCEGDTVNA